MYLIKYFQKKINSNSIEINLTQKDMNEFEWIFKKVLGESFQSLQLNQYDQLSQKQIEICDELIEQKWQQIPIDYILGTSEFYDIELEVNSSVLIPRPETELMVDLIIELCKKHYTNNKTIIEILDLGTGSGCIAISLAKHIKNSKITAVDQELDSLQLAKKNAQLNAVQDKIEFIHSNWFENVQLNQKFDIILSNPPYVSEQDYQENFNLLRYEPKQAIVSLGDEYKNYQIISHKSTDYLNNKGWLCFEHGNKQTKRVSEILAQNNFNEINTIMDYQRHPRVTYGSFQPN